jgi:hypothetical protein
MLFDAGYWPLGFDRQARKDGIYQQLFWDELSFSAIHLFTTTIEKQHPAPSAER